jgi:small subunit ribosomal protein S20
MPIIKSAKKRVRIAKKASVRNSKTKRSLKSALKSFHKAPAIKSQSKVQSELDKAVKRGVIHKNKAARQKSKLAAQAKASGSKPTTVKKTSAKKSVTKKNTTRKVSVKK